MTLRQFIRDNKEELDTAIKQRCPGIKLTNEERRLWILNDEDLYHWARNEGCRI